MKSYFTPLMRGMSASLVALPVSLLVETASAQSIDPYDRLGSALERTYGITPDATVGTLPRIPDENLTLDLKRVEIDTADAPQKVVPVSRLDTYMIQFQPDASVDEIQRVLQTHGLQVADEPEKNEALSRIGTLIVERVQKNNETGEINEVFSEPLLQRLRADPRVRSAVPDLVISTEKMPRPPATPMSGSSVWDWGVVDACVPALAHHAPEGQRDGNWGLKVARFPAAWRLVSNRVARENRAPAIKTAVLDAGFNTNDDLEFELFEVGTHNPHDHGTHVAGIIGATFDNEKGIDGASPWARIVAVPHTRHLVNIVEGDTEERVVALQSDIVVTLVAMLDIPDVRVINISLGYNWKKHLGIDPGGDDFGSIRNDISAAGNIVQSLLNLAANRNILIVSAAGNDSDLEGPTHLDVEAQWSSPFNWAALNDSDLFPVQNVLVVEAFDRAGKRAPFSNRGGHVSAPGTGILSTVGNGYKTDTGTSMAAPHVAALATLLIAYDPDITQAEIARAIREGTRPGLGGVAPRIDALNALVVHDPNALRYLADLDGDGEVGVPDAEIFKHQWAKLHDPGSQNVATGPNDIIEAVTSEAEPSAVAAMIDEDLNGNGVIDQNEAAWPLIDLNGSGVVTNDICDRVPLGGVEMTDRDVLGLAWTDSQTPFDPTALGLCDDCDD